MNPFAINRLVLGTVQFGLPYGIAAGYKQVFHNDVADILDYARTVGIECLDTASSYGNSEEVLGFCASTTHFKIFSKTWPIREDELSPAHLKHIQTAFENSLKRLKREQLDVLMVHDARDLLAKGGDQLWKWLEILKNSGRVARIGVSVYECETAKILSDRYKIDVIQLPYSILDQRAHEADFFEYCKYRSIAIHVRSIFLQGLLLSNIENVPSNLKSLIPYLTKISNLASKLEISIHELALAFISRNLEIEHIVIGVHNTPQCKQLISSWSKIKSLRIDYVNWESLKCNKTALIDPRLWA